MYTRIIANHDIDFRTYLAPLLRGMYTLNNSYTSHALETFLMLVFQIILDLKKTVSFRFTDELDACLHLFWSLLCKRVQVQSTVQSTVKT